MAFFFVLFCFIYFILFYFFAVAVCLFIYLSWPITTSGYIPICLQKWTDLRGEKKLCLDDEDYDLGVSPAMCTCY